MVVDAVVDVVVVVVVVVVVGSWVVVVLLVVEVVEVEVVVDMEALRTARTEAVPLLPPLLPNASTLAFRKPTNHAFDAPETEDVDDQ